jgi:hypothetical protein
MEMADDHNEVTQSGPISAVAVVEVEEDDVQTGDVNTKLPDPSASRVPRRETKAKNGGSGPSQWVRRSTRRVKKDNQNEESVPEEELAAILAEPSAEASEKVTQKGPTKQKRSREIQSGRESGSEEGQKTVSEGLKVVKVLKTQTSRNPSKTASANIRAGISAPTPSINEPTEAQEFEQAKELEGQRRLLFLSMLERQQGYDSSNRAVPESAMRSSLEHDVSNDDFTAAFNLRQMARQGPPSDPPSKAFIQRLLTMLDFGGTMESNDSIKGEEVPRDSSLRRSERNKTPIAVEVEGLSSLIAQSKRPTPEPLNLDQDGGFMPSAATDFKFKYDSPSGRRAEELDALLKPPPRPKMFTADLASEKVFIAKSYKVFGSKPKANAADQLIEQMELEMEQRRQEIDMEMQEEDG